MNEIKVFENENFGTVRTLSISGEPWFVLADVCKVLEISHIKDTVNRLDKDDLGLTEVIDRLGRKQTAAMCEESGINAGEVIGNTNLQKVREVAR